jgi:PAS domain S-box-containing protein
LRRQRPPTFSPYRKLRDQLFERSSDPAFIVDPLDDRILAVNRAGRAMLGYTREELLATPVSKIHPAELPQLREFLANVLQDGKGSTIKLTCRTKSGTFLPTETALVALESGGRTLHPRVVQDRSEHRQREPERWGRAQAADRTPRHSHAVATNLVSDERGGSFLLELLQFAGWQLQIRDGAPPTIRAMRAGVRLEVAGASLAEAAGTVFAHAMRSSRRLKG